MRALIACAVVLGGCSQAEFPTEGSQDQQVAAASDVGAPTGRGNATTALGPTATRQLNFRVTQQSDGSVSGGYYVKRSDNGAWFRGRATCMAIVGDTVWIAGITTETNVPNVARIKTVSYFYAVDQGSGSPPDLVSAVRLNDVAGQDAVFCRDRPTLLGFNPLIGGDVVVR